MKKSKINLGDLIFILFYKFHGIIKGSTTLQKLIDIIRLDSEFEVDVKYDPYNFGDFSQDVVDVITVCQDNGWILSASEAINHDKSIDIYKLSEKGNIIAKKVFENLIHKDKERLKLLDDLIDIPQNDLISFSYFWYPETAIKSKITNRIFERIPLSQCVSDILEEEYNMIIQSGKSVKEVINESWKW